MFVWCVNHIRMRTPASFMHTSELRDSFLRFEKTCLLADNKFMTIDMHTLLDLTFDTVLNRFSFHLKKAKSEDVISHVVIPLAPKMSMMFGFGYKTTTLYLKRLVTRRTASDSFLSTATVYDINDFDQFQHEYVSEHTVDLSAGIHNMVVHSNLLHNSFIGDNRYDVLDVVPIVDKHSHYTTYEPNNLIYKAVRKEQFNDVHIDIYNSKNQRAQFMSGSTPVQITQLFKRIDVAK